MLNCFQNKLIEILEVQLLVFCLNLREVVPNFRIKKEDSMKQTRKFFNPLSAKLRKWPNTFKQFVSNLPTNCLSVLGHFVGLAVKRLNLEYFLNIFGFSCLTFTTNFLLRFQIQQIFLLKVKALPKITLVLWYSI